MDLRSPALNQIIDQWINEDLGNGDLTRFALGNRVASAHWIAKNNGVFCGGELVSEIFRRLDKNIIIEILVKDGEKFDSGQKLLRVNGQAASLVAAERTALNIAMHLSGISTKTSYLVGQLEGTGVYLADTRKTTPGLRVMEKYAVKCGGGINHRLGLDDAAMLKENHIAWSGGVKNALKNIKLNIPWTSKIIVEAETAQEAVEAVEAGADGILLDEMIPSELTVLIPKLRKLAAETSSKKIVIEVSGINADEIKNYASTGVDLISSSAPITKSFWVDFSMRFDSSS